MISKQFRFLRRSWRKSAPWDLSDLISDEIAVSRGYVLGGQGRDTSDLTEEERVELMMLLGRRPSSFSDEECKRQKELLSRTGFTQLVGPIDIDVNTLAANFDPEIARKKALEYAKRLAHYAPELGLGDPNWFSVSWMGGFHADLIAPEGFSDPDLLHGVRLMVERLALRTEVPLYLKQPAEAKRDKTVRTDVYLDDSVLNKNANARGGLWRLPGKAKPKGKKKTAVDVLATGCPELLIPYVPTPIDKEALKESIAKYKLSRIKPEKYKATIPLKEPAPIEVRTGYATSEDLSFLRKHSPLLNIWNQENVTDRSYRDFDMALQATKLGASEDSALRLMRAMPGSKATQDHRGFSYDRSILGSVERFISSVGDATNYEGFIKPENYLHASREVILKAVDLTVDWKIKNKLIATLACGEAVVYSECSKDSLVEVEGIHRCERVTCSYCEPRRVKLQIDSASKAWPSELIVARLDTNSDSIASCKKSYSKFKDKLKDSFKKKKARKLLSRLRCFRAPGEVFVVFNDASRFEKLSKLFGDVVKKVSKSEALEELKATLYKRFKRIQTYILQGDAEALASDPWVGHVVSITSGRKSKLPWLSKEAIRQKAKSDANSRRGKSECCAVKKRYHVTDAVSGKKLRTSEVPIKSDVLERLLYRSRHDNIPTQEWYILPRPPD